MNEIDYISNYESKFYRSAIPHIRPTTIVAVAFKNRDSGGALRKFLCHSAMKLSTVLRGFHQCRRAKQYHIFLIVLRVWNKVGRTSNDMALMLVGRVYSCFIARLRKGGCVIDPGFKNIMPGRILNEIISDVKKIILVILLFDARLLTSDCGDGMIDYYY
ncbi:unnamed protein product [Lactuca virosa]|uniref:Uncharacterized protein n=1 Tax=Lactuca virosa TaxID=75947 RepID=A0AAU9NMS4_9ASTR|nr:unnamed protein product [Lactuca virosa]